LAEKKNIFERIWGFFASLKLAIVLLLLLAVTSIIGTVIEQNVEPAKNIQLLTKIFGVRTAPTLYNIFVRLGFMDMYHSWWYTSLLTLFALNLTICSLERLPKTWRLIKRPITPLPEDTMKGMPIKREMKIKTSLTTARDEIVNALRKARYNVFEASDEGGVQLYTQKGNYTRLGVYVVHCSILLILGGAIIGARFGFDGFLNLPEGGASSYAYTRSGEPVPLGFTIKCNWYDTRYYPGTDTPQEFQSELVILENGREVLKKRIEVNNPLKYKGFTFYQSSYGMIPDAEGEFILKVINNKGEERLLYLHLGDSFEIPGTGIRGKIVDFSPALGRDPSTGELITYADTMVNPAVAIQFNIEGGAHGADNGFKGWILRRYPETGLLPGGSKVEFIDYWGVEYTGLQVSKDPGVWIIYLASIIMGIGLYIAFFMSHRKIWVRLTVERSGGENSVRVLIVGSTSRNRLALERQVEHILERATETIKQRHPKRR